MSRTVRRPRVERPRVKVCGVTSPEDAVLAVERGADFLGLNFYPPSPRHLAPERAAEIAAAARETRPEIRLVGVFVNLEPAEIERIAATVGLDLLQFHGDETPAQIAPTADRAIKVMRVRERLDPASFEEFPGVWGFLVDYRHPELYGGSGESWDFSSLAGLLATPDFIAGGLGPQNVRAALAASGAWGVDVCSGIESSPGKKDPHLLDRLFSEIDRFSKESK